MYVVLGRSKRPGNYLRGGGWGWGGGASSIISTPRPLGAPRAALLPPDPQGPREDLVGKKSEFLYGIYLHCPSQSGRLREKRSSRRKVAEMHRARGRGRQ